MLLRRTYARLAIGLVFCLGVFFLIVVLADPRQSAAQSTQLLGYAWSDTIGWISLSGSGYGLSVDGSGNLSGYAWSEHIGWVSAEPADIAGCPAGTCQPRVSGGSFAGWIKAIGAGGNGWDGWISLHCSNTGSCGTSNYGVTLTSGTLSGYAWGSDVVGWIDFNYGSGPAPSCAFNPATQSIVRGSNTTLSWTSTNATSGFISLIGPVSTAGSVGVNPTATTTYSATFGGGGGYGSCEATVNVSCAPLYSCNGQTIQYTTAGCVTTNVTTCVSPNYCEAGKSTCSVPPVSYDPSGTLTASPQLVRYNGTSTVSWSVQNASSCTVTGNGNTWNGLTSAGAACTHKNGACVTNPVTTSVRYTLTCTALPGATPPAFTDSVTIVPSPVYEER